MSSEHVKSLNITSLENVKIGFYFMIFPYTLELRVVSYSLFEGNQTKKKVEIVVRFLIVKLASKLFFCLRLFA